MDKASERLTYYLREAAAMLGISQRKLWGMTSPRGSLVSTRLGRRVMYSRDDLEQFIVAQRQTLPNAN